MRATPLVRPLSSYPPRSVHRLFAAQPALAPQSRRGEPQRIHAVQLEPRGGPPTPPPEQPPNGGWKAWVKVVRGTVLEAMAATVPKKEREFFAGRWGFVLPVKEPVPAEVPVVEELEPKAMPELVAEAAETSLHPVLGELVTDLGYKRTYTSTLQNLITVPIWKKQRTLRPERAKKIAAFKLKGHSPGRPIGLPGVITLYQDAGSRQLGIVDGQHRLAALVTLCEKQAWDMNAANITVDVFDTMDESEVKDLFIEINSAEPLKLVDMPGEGADEDLKDVLAKAVDALAEQHPGMFKESQRCRPPHVNKDNLRDDLFQSDLLQKHSIRTPDQLLQLLDDINASLGGRKREEWNDLNSRLSPAKVSFEDALKKATANKFFLGLDSNWDKVFEPGRPTTTPASTSSPIQQSSGPASQSANLPLPARFCLSSATARRCRPPAIGGV
eukprot:CAMPEP_0117673794 /NCGR_PEP_ID=MMETSP0804-20121206/14673_1 /TAXON_ID=1074897 /ORGANISM="Tetraselmis astigmatica, Strain CCMP880" /LENGTH=441 /DNA_ID=CAMNT_0005482577 /DNA_START=57 /DNA_END=1379 /DNA_ORIENTATION=-